jgi:ABC-2 type transport system permease protein
MPDWLQVIARFNPLSYQVDALRSLMLSGASSSFGIALDFAVLVGVTVVLVLVAGRLYPRLAR